MTYRVIPDDNLLVLTDREGSIDRTDQILAEAPGTAGGCPRPG